MPTPTFVMQDLDHLLPTSWESKIDEWLHEDIPSFDYGGFVVGNKEERAEILCKANGVLCGVPFVTRIFTVLGCKIEWHKSGTTGSIVN